MPIAMQLDAVAYEVIKASPDMNLLLFTDPGSGFQVRVPLADADVEGLIRKLRGGNNIVPAHAGQLPKEMKR